MRSRVEALESEAARPDLWEDRERAEKLLREKSLLERDAAQIDRLAEMLDEVGVLLELADEVDERLSQLEARVRDLTDERDKLERKLQRDSPLKPPFGFTHDML